MKKLKTRDEFLNESHGMNNELENARMMRGSASELVEWAQRKIAESRPENFKEGVINPVQEAKYSSSRDADDIFFLWDAAVDDDRQGIEHGNFSTNYRTINNGSSGSKRYSQFIFNDDAKGFDDFEKKVEALMKKNKWEYDFDGDVLNIYESVNEGSKDEQVKKECISRLSDFFRVTPNSLSKFNFDGKDNIKELTRALNSTSDKGTELYYQTAIKSVKRDLGVNESEVNEGMGKFVAGTLNTPFDTLKIGDVIKLDALDYTRRGDDVLNIYESVNEKKSKEVTKKMWDKMGEDDRIDALHSAFEDPDDAEKWFDKDWDQLPPQATSNMTIYEGYEFVNLTPKQDKLKTAIKKQERVAGLKANRSKPIEFDQLSLNRIMLTKVLGRGDLEKEHEDAYQRLLKKYELKESIYDTLDHEIVMAVLDVAGQFTSDANPAASQQWNSLADLADYIKGDFIAKKWHKAFDEGVDRIKKRHNIKESVNESSTIKISKLSDIDHTRIIKWMNNQFDSNKYDMKKSGSGFVIDANKLSKTEQEDLMYYLKSQSYIKESVNEEYELNEAAGMGTMVALAIALGLGIRLSFMPESKLQQILSTTKALGRSAWQSIKDFGYAVKRELPVIGLKIKKREADDKAYKDNVIRVDKLKADIESYIANNMSDEDIIEIFKSNKEFKYILEQVARGKRVDNTSFYNAVKKMLSGKSTKGSTPEPITKLMKKIKADLSMLESVEFEMMDIVNESKWTTPAGFFTRSSNEMARVLYESSTDLDQALNNLNESFDTVKALLDNKSKANIEIAKNLLEQKYK